MSISIATTGIEALTDVVPEETLVRWRRHGGVQEATFWAARDGDRVVAATLEVHRPLTAYRLILDLWSETVTAERSLVEAIEERAWSEGAAVVKRWLPTSDQEPLPGYEETPVPRHAGPVAGPYHRDPGAGHLRFRGNRPSRTVPYLRQTTDFTCGPAALLMGLAALGLRGEPDRQDEIRLWRSANTIAGSEPLGLTLAALGEGADARVSLSTREPTLLELCSTDEERDLRGFIQSGFRAELAERGTEVRTEAFAVDEVRRVVEAGGVVLVLIEQQGMHAESCPHWILVHDHRDGIFWVNDPWTDADLGETFLDGWNLPMPASTLDRLAWFGQPSYRGMVVLTRPASSVRPASSIRPAGTAA